MATVKAKKGAGANKEVVDVEEYPENQGEKVIVTRRVSSRKTESSIKRKVPHVKAPTAKKAKATSGGKSPRDDPEETEGSGDNLRTRSHYAIIADTPEPSHCHRVIATCAPKGWIKGLDRMAVAELADLQSQSALQLAIVDNVLNTKARDASEGLVRCQEEVKMLNSKLSAQEEETKVMKTKLLEVTKSIEESEQMTKAKEEMKRLRDALHEQTLEMTKLRVEKAEAVEKSSQLSPLKTKCQSLGEEISKLRDHVAEVEKTKGELITKVIPHVCKSLIDSEEAGVLLANCINSARVWERAIVLEELAASGQAVVLSQRNDYNTEAAHLFESASEALAHAQFPYVQEISSKPDASIEELLSISPKKESLS